MIEDMLRELFGEPTEADLNAQAAIGQVCEFNQFNMLGCLLVDNALGGFDRQTIADKVNALATPFKLVDFKSVH